MFRPKYALAVLAVAVAILAFGSLALTPWRNGGRPSELASQGAALANGATPEATGSSVERELTAPETKAIATPSSTATEPPTPTASVIASPTASLTATATPLPPTATPSSTPTVTPTPEPQPTPDGIVRCVRVPILNYHYVSVAPEDADAVRRDLSVSPAEFEAQLRYLREAGFTSISLHDLMLHLATGRALPDKPVILTFDDGYIDNYQFAFPLLIEHGYEGTFFLITAFQDEARPNYMSWDNVVEMHAAGMEFGAHSYNHADLRGQSADYLVWQILGPREAIEERIREPVRFFCYPSGRYDDQVIAVLHSAHYWGAVTIHQGTVQCSEAPFELQRVRVHGGDSLDKFVEDLNYWLHEGQ